MAHDEASLKKLKVADLRDILEGAGGSAKGLKKGELIDAILASTSGGGEGAQVAQVVKEEGSGMDVDDADSDAAAPPPTLNGSTNDNENDNDCENDNVGDGENENDAAMTAITVKKEDNEVEKNDKDDGMAPLEPTQHPQQPLPQMATSPFASQPAIGTLMASLDLPSLPPPPPHMENRYSSALATLSSQPFNTDAWATVVTEVKLGRSGVEGVTTAGVLGEMLKRFPTSGTYWGELIREWEKDRLTPKETTERRIETAFNVILGVSLHPESPYNQFYENFTVNQRITLGICSGSIDLWTMWLERVKARAVLEAIEIAPDDEAMRQTYMRDRIGAAYEIAGDRAGFIAGANSIWTGYIGYLSAWDTSNSTSEKTTKTTRLRNVYQMAVSIPQSGLDELFLAYSAFEKNINRQLSEEILPGFEERQKHAKAVHLERNMMASELQMIRLAQPPQNTETEEYLLSRWRKRIAYERSNPERLPVQYHAQRVRQAYIESVAVLFRHPEFYSEWAAWEWLSFRNGKGGAGVEGAMSVYQIGRAALPGSVLLANSEAEMMEVEGRVDLAASCLEHLTDRAPSALAFVLWEKLARRKQGMEEAREVFTRAREVLRLKENVEATVISSSNAIMNREEVEGGGGEGGSRRRLGHISAEVYTNHATIEWRQNKQPEVSECQPEVRRL